MRAAIPLFEGVSRAGAIFFSRRLEADTDALVRLALSR